MVSSNMPLTRVYAFSDCYGRSKNPFTQDDADALICTDFRSFPLLETKRDFDIYGRESIVEHLVRLIFALHDEIRESSSYSKAIKEAFKKTTTGIFINWAPRTAKDNGSLFYVATAKNLRIVTTSLEALSSVKHRIDSLAHIPNNNNGLWGPNEQFRSSFAAGLLYADHGFKLQTDKISIIPDYPSDRWELAYVDRFGNLISYCKDPKKKWAEVVKAAKASKDGTVNVVIGNVSQRLKLTTSLKDAEPGALVIYPNNNVDVVRKWEAEEDKYERLYKSAYFQYAKPDIGSAIKIPKSKK
jgi:hypothetical protein